MLGVLLFSVSPAQDLPSAAGHRTGLLRDDDARVRALVESHPRVTGVRLNWLGLERVDAARAARGLAPLGVRSVDRVGRELVSSLPGRRLRPGRRPGPPRRRRPARLRRQQRAQVLPAHPEPEPARLVRLVLVHLLPALLHGRLPAGPRHPGPRRQHEQVLPEVVLQHAQRRQATRGPTSARTTISSNGTGPRPGPSSPTTPISRPGAWTRRPGVTRSRVRTDPVQYLRDVSEDAGLDLLKQLLTNGYVMVFGTYVSSWQLKDDPGRSRRPRPTTRAVGRRRRLLGQRRRGLPRHDRRRLQRRRLDRHQRQRRHRHGREGRPAHRQLLGQPAGATAASSGWPTTPSRAIPAVAGAPTTPREPAFFNDMVFLLTVRDGLRAPDDRRVHGQPRQAGPAADVPRAFGDLGHDPLDDLVGDGPSEPGRGLRLRRHGDGRRRHLRPRLHRHPASRAAAPCATTWGCATARPDDTATLKAFKIVDLTTDPATEAVSTQVPKTADGGAQVYSWVDYTYAGPAYNHAPELLYARVSPGSGTAATSYTFSVQFGDEDGDSPSVRDVYVDGTPHATTYSASDGRYRWTTSALAAGRAQLLFPIRGRPGRRGPGPTRRGDERPHGVRLHGLVPLALERAGGRRGLHPVRPRLGFRLGGHRDLGRERPDDDLCRRHPTRRRDPRLRPPAGQGCPDRREDDGRRRVQRPRFPVENPAPYADLGLAGPGQRRRGRLYSDRPRLELRLELRGPMEWAGQDDDLRQRHGAPGLHPGRRHRGGRRVRDHGRQPDPGRRRLGPGDVHRDRLHGGGHARDENDQRGLERHLHGPARAP
ncbi:MAG: hypothetical protein MZW92_02225 [Comamonadaceae bacterium]|nr:hypothetical protein [Comamonadaceae bacterium]